MKLFILMIVFSLTATVMSMELTIPQTATPPTMDGTPLKEEWKNALVMNNFFVSGQNRLAMEPTRVYLMHDNRCLYIGIIMKEFALNPISNMLKEFKATLHGDNQPVWNDDSAEIRLATADRQLFYLGFNANGATKSIVPFGIASRWFELKTAIGTGEWSAEIAAPLKVCGDLQRINVVRFEKRLPEKTSMAPIPDDDHGSFRNMFRLKMGNLNTPGLEIPDLRLASANELTVRSSRLFSGSWRLKTNLSSSQGQIIGKDHIFKLGTGNATGQITGISMEFNQGAESFFSSPVYPFSERGGRLQFNLLTPGATVRFNGEQQETSGSLYTFYPRAGENLLELISPNPEVVLGRTDKCGILSWSGHWEYQHENKWMEMPADIQDGRIVLKNDSPDGPWRFRQKILFGGDLLEIPGVAPEVLTLTSGGTYPIFWNPLKKLGCPVDGLHLNLLLPREVELVGAASKESYPDGFPDFNWPAEKNPYHIMRHGVRVIDNTEYIHYQIKRDTPLRKLAMPPYHQLARERCVILLRGGAVGFKGRFFYFTASKTPALSEIPESHPLEVVPELTANAPRVLRIFFYPHAVNDLPSDTMNQALMNTWRSAGVNELFWETGTPVTGDFTTAAAFNLERYPWRRGYPVLKEFIRKHPDAVAINAENKKSGYLSLSYLADHPETEPDLEEALRRLKAVFPSLKILFWDYEHDPFTGLYADYGKETLAIFQRIYQIPEKHLTPELIRKHHPRQWIDFRARELGRAAEVVRKLAVRNGFELSFYSDYDSPHAIAMYSLDWQYMRNGAEKAYMGYGRDLKSIARTRAKLPGKPLIFGILTAPGCATYQRAILLRRLLDSRAGILCWYEKGFGGAELQEIAAVANLAAKYEEFFLRGKPITGIPAVSGTLPDNVVSLQLGDEILTLVLNESDLPEWIKLTFPAQAVEFYSGRQCPAKETVRFKVPAWGIMAFHLTK